MHYHTVNKYLKDIRVAQMMVRDLEEVTLRHNPEIAKQAAVVERELEGLLDELLKVDYDK